MIKFPLIATSLLKHDYSVIQLKRMKAIEEERDALLKGLQTVERAEQWYRDQLANVQVDHTGTTVQLSFFSSSQTCVLGHALMINHISYSTPRVQIIGTW